jgi:hypothetical protein
LEGSDNDGSFSDLVLRTDGFSTMTPPDKSPEPTAVGAVSSAVAVPAASRRWLSFFVRRLTFYEDYYFIIADGSLSVLLRTD